MSSEHELLERREALKRCFKNGISPRLAEAALKKAYSLACYDKTHAQRVIDSIVHEAESRSRGTANYL